MEHSRRRSPSLAYSQTSLGPQNKPRFIPLRNRAFSSLSTPSLPPSPPGKSARCNKCTRSSPSVPFRSVQQRQQGDGGMAVGGCISGTLALCLFSSNPITPRPPSSLGIRINTTTLSPPSSLPLPLSSCKPLSQRLRWVGASAVTMQAGNLPLLCSM